MQALLSGDEFTTLSGLQGAVKGVFTWTCALHWPGYISRAASELLLCVYIPIRGRGWGACLHLQASSYHIALAAAACAGAGQPEAVRTLMMQ